ncbi:hypothetical protein Hanom_Chr04g00374251 [Helianthus anomalus]
MPGKKAKSGPTILHLDSSLKLHDRTKIVKNCKSFLEEELKHCQGSHVSRIVDKEIHVTFLFTKNHQMDYVKV